MLKPMLSATLEDPAKLNFPVLVSPKLDGIRCLIVDGQPMSRNMKAIQNKHVFDELARLPALDGELIVGNPKAGDVFNRTSSGIMSRDGVPKFAYYVFDRHDTPEASFRQRLTDVSGMVRDFGGALRLVHHKEVRDVDALLRYESQMLIAGYEGIMVRDPRGVYKMGRSTLREGLLSKLKRFIDSEARVTGFVERMHNANEQTRDELGRAKRSSAQAGKVATGMLGALTVTDVTSKVEFEIGTGFTDTERCEIWANKKKYLGKLVKYKSQPVGVKDKPRFPVFLGWRSLADL